jgi:hypothetical protein
MTEIDIHAVNARRGAHLDSEDTGAVVVGLTNWLYLAATPTFAVMALLTWMAGGDADMMCSAAHGVSPLSGMVPMYVLMSAFHSAPWLKLIFRRRSAAPRSSQMGLRRSR